MHTHPHEHEHHPGLFHQRDAPLDRDYSQRAFTIGIGGPVGSGKTALLLALCCKLRDRVQLAVVTNDIFTREDAEFLVRNEALPQERIRAVETGGCPHAAVRDDISHNLVMLERLMAEFRPDLMFVESGGGSTGPPLRPPPAACTPPSLLFVRPPTTPPPHPPPHPTLL